jgi:hypothetical protein
MRGGALAALDVLRRCVRDLIAGVAPPGRVRSARKCRGSRAILPVSARTGADRILPAGRPAEVAGPARVCDHALVSMTTTIQVGERGFWATKDAFGAWMGYLAEEIADRAPVLLDPALSALAEKWRVAAVVTDFGADAGELSDGQRSALRAIAAAARARAESVGRPVNRADAAVDHSR